MNHYLHQANIPTPIRYILGSLWTLFCVLVLLMMHRDLGGTASLFFVFCISFIPSFCVNLLVPLLAVEMDWGYFSSKPFEQSGNIYPKFGVLQFRAFLKKIGWSKALKNSRNRLRTVDGLREFVLFTRTAEIAHIVPLILSFWFIGGAIARQQWLSVVLLTALNIFYHIYPIMLQRYNRPIALRKIAEATINV